MNVDLIDMQDRTKGGFYWYFVAVDEFSSLLHLAGNKSKHKEGVEQGLQNIVKPYNAQRHKVKCPHNPRLCPTPLPPLEETSMDTQSPRAVGDPPLGLGPIPMADLPRGPLRACPRFAPPPPGLHLQVADSIPYQCISEGAIGPEDWHWATAGHAPLLGALRGTVNTLSLSAYLSTRDSSRALRGAPLIGRVPPPDSQRASGT